MLNLIDYLVNNHFYSFKIWNTLFACFENKQRNTIQTL